MTALFRGRLGRTSTVPPLEPIPAIADLPQAKMQARTWSFAEAAKEMPAPTLCQPPQ